MKFEVRGQGSLSDFLGDAVVYRSLVPIDSRLPCLEDLRRRLGLHDTEIPRKVELTYARVVVEMLRAATALRGSPEITSVIMIGDTEHNDGGAFRNICELLSRPAGAFICDEDAEDERLSMVTGDPRGNLYVANRWGLLDRFEKEIVGTGAEIGPGSVVIIDIDKTALGARGRNHQPIDAARVAAVTRTAKSVLGEFDEDLVMAGYHRFNAPRFHEFTTDNQDYLAYLALIIGGGWISPEMLESQISGGELSSFEELLESVTLSERDLPSGLREMHRSVMEAVTVGDPTPFKDFRKSEFLETIVRMDPTDSPREISQILGSKVTITDEVRTKAFEWRDRGALIFGLSDKPDEASCPPAGDAETTGPALHRAPAWIVGEVTD